MGLEAPAPRWGLTRRVLFRFAFAYFLLYNFPVPLNLLPFGQLAIQPYDKLWQLIAVEVGRLVFGVEITVFQNGSGDTTFNYVQVFCFAVLAANVAALWSLLDHDRPNYERLHRGLRVYLRFVLAAWMLMYGSVKVIKTQFPDLSLERLLQPFGDASPMGLLWTFMGASESYTIFTGVGEMLGGILLTFRRTTLLGALVSAGVMTHVVVLNFSYDVPVKLFSVHLLLMALFLTLPDLRRLADLFVFRRGVGPVEFRPIFANRWLHYGTLTLRTLLVAAFTGMLLFSAYQTRTNFIDGPKPPLHGIWAVEEFELDGQPRPPIMTDATRWRRVVITNPRMIAVQLMSDTRVRYGMELNTDARTIALKKRDDSDWKSQLTYAEPEPGRLTVEGTFDGKPLKATLRRADDKQFLLVNRGFHWINEYPFNR